jgi:GntR family transcriptional regulator
MLERKPSLTEQAKAHIKQRIVNDEFEDGRIPSETELASELGVSRTTIRDALSRLENEGAVYRRQGSGTYVNNPGLQIKTRLEEIWSYEAVLRAHGYTPSTRIISVKHKKAGDEQAQSLNLEPGADLVTVEKLFLEDQKPVIFAVNCIPRRLLTEPYVDEDWHAPIYEFISEHGQQRLNYYVSEIVPVTATAKLARILHVKEGRALISFVETGYNEENEPILLAASYIRDDLLRLRLIRRKVA